MIDRPRGLFVLASTFALAACGGGEGGGVASTPTTPSAPTLPGTGTNASLVGTLQSENFANIASAGLASISRLNAVPTFDHGAITLQVVYDAATKSYALKTGATSETFAPADKDASLSNAAVTTYKHLKGADASYLTLTVPGTASGQTRYVGAGFWQRSVTSAATLDVAVDTFVYGAATASPPRTGSASYGVNLVGVALTNALDVYGLAGSGRLFADFGSGKVALDADYAINGGTQKLIGFASIAADGKGFSGKFDSGYRGWAPGTWQGGFFGPDAAEVGATGAVHNENNLVAFALTGARDGQDAAGTITAPLGRGLTMTRDSTTGAVRVSQSSRIVSAFTPDGGDPVFVRSDGTIERPSAPPAGLSYTQLTDVPGTSVKGFLLSDERSSDYVTADYILSGAATPVAAMPRTGSADYRVVLHATAMANDYTALPLVGQGILKANFATGALTADGPYLRNRSYYSAMAGAPGGTWHAAATLAASNSTFSGTFSTTGADSWQGTLEGGFFGATAQDVGAVIQATDAKGELLAGMILGTQQPALAPLADLGGETVLSADLAFYDSPADGRLPPYRPISNDTTISYDPATRSYRVANWPTVAGSERDPATSTASTDSYAGAGYTAAFQRPGGSGAPIALTYTSFGHITATGAPGSTPAAAVWLAYGQRTPGYMVPTSGTATYSGIAAGQGHDMASGHDVTLSGTSALRANFDRNFVQATLNLVSTDAVTGASRAMDTISGGTGLQDVCTDCNRATFWISLNAGMGGSLTGQFNGPHAEEYSGAFAFEMRGNPGDPANGSAYSGVIAGKRD